MLVNLCITNSFNAVCLLYELVMKNGYQTVGPAYH